MFGYIKSHKKSAILVAVIVLLLIVFGVLEFTGRTNLILDRGPKKVADNTTKTTSNVESAQSEFNSGSQRKAMQSREKPKVGVVDTKGSIKPSGSRTITSSDGIITIFSPSANSILTSGSSLIGETSSSKVSYRLIDNVSGVIATGDLTTVNGKFSGKFNFSTSASEGRLDVFIVKPDLSEKSVVEITVRFQ